MANVVNEIPVESLQSLLTFVRSETSPPGCTNIPGLDAHIFNAVPHHASALSSLNRKDVIEIQGPSVGKSHLLMHIIITCIIPRQYLSVSLGGWDRVAVVLDVDHTFDVRRFRRLLLSRLMRVLAPLSLDCDVIDQVAGALLQKVHIFQPKSSFHLANTILNLTQYHSTNLPDAEIGLVAIDSMSSWHWQDRLYAEQPRNPSTPRTPPGIEHALKALEGFRKSHGPVVIFTNWGLNHLSKTSPFYKQHVYALHSPFSTTPNNVSKPVIILPLTHHITLRATTSPTLQTWVVEALVRTVASNTGVGNFTFRITDKDILIEHEKEIV